MGENVLIKMKKDVIARQLLLYQIRRNNTFGVINLTKLINWDDEFNKKIYKESIKSNNLFWIIEAFISLPQTMRPGALFHLLTTKKDLAPILFQYINTDDLFIQILFPERQIVPITVQTVSLLMWLKNKNIVPSYYLIYHLTKLGFYDQVSALLTHAHLQSHQLEELALFNTSRNIMYHNTSLSITHNSHFHQILQIESEKMLNVNI